MKESYKLASKIEQYIKDDLGVSVTIELINDCLSSLGGYSPKTIENARLILTRAYSE